MRSSPLLLLSWALFLSGGCSLSASEAPGVVESSKRPEPEIEDERAQLLPWSPPADWRRLAPTAFEALVEKELPVSNRSNRSAGPDVAGGRALDRAALAELAAALDEQNAASVRAAVILGRSTSDEAAELLLARLEKRAPAEARSADAGDVVAAAALLRFPQPERFAARLALLGAGASPHPDLEVRVECAAGALDLGRTEGIPFLLQVLGIGTPRGELDQRDFAVSPTTAWARTRAGRALSSRAGLPNRYRADAPLAQREEVRQELAAALAR